MATKNPETAQRGLLDMLWALYEHAPTPVLNLLLRAKTCALPLGVPVGATSKYRTFWVAVHFDVKTAKDRRIKPSFLCQICAAYTE